MYRYRFDKDIFENIDIEKEISENIDIDKISNRLEFGISNRATKGGEKQDFATRQKLSFFVGGLSVVWLCRWVRRGKT